MRQWVTITSSCPAPHSTRISIIRRSVWRMVVVCHSVFLRLQLLPVFVCYIMCKFRQLQLGLDWLLQIFGSCPVDHFLKWGSPAWSIHFWVMAITPRRRASAELCAFSLVSYPPSHVGFEFVFCFSFFLFPFRSLAICCLWLCGSVLRFADETQW